VETAMLQPEADDNDNDDDGGGGDIQGDRIDYTLLATPT